MLVSIDWVNVVASDDDERREYSRFRVLEKAVRKISSPTHAIRAGFSACIVSCFDMTGSAFARGSKM